MLPGYVTGRVYSTQLHNQLAIYLVGNPHVRLRNGHGWASVQNIYNMMTSFQYSLKVPWATFPVVRSMWELWLTCVCNGTANSHSCLYFVDSREKVEYVWGQNATSGPGGCWKLAVGSVADRQTDTLWTKTDAENVSTSHTSTKAWRYHSIQL